MSKELSLVLEDDVAFQTGPDLAQLMIDGAPIELGLDDLGKMSEWLAVAWENLAGEQYKPVVISEGGYVTDRGIEVVAVVRPGEHVIPKAHLSMPGLDRLEKLERDCE